MFWGALILYSIYYLLNRLFVPLALSYGNERIKYHFDKKRKTLDNNNQKATYIIKKPRIINKYYGNNPELPE